MNEDNIKKLEELTRDFQQEFDLFHLFEVLFILPFYDPISLSFILLIFIVFISSLFPSWPKMLTSHNLEEISNTDKKFFVNILKYIYDYNNHIALNAVSILPTIGILGTFVGVLVAVSNFNNDYVWNSLGIIIQGLKIAFVTSVYGLASSLFLRFFRAKDIVNSVDIGPEHIFNAIKEEKSELEKNRAVLLYIQENAETHNNNLIKAIRGNNDGDLLSIMYKIHSDFQTFSEKLAQSNTDIFIKALKEAIQDFNKNLTDQFGENFKELNSSVGKLLEWQENNKNDMDNLRETLDKSIHSIQKTDQSLISIEKSTSSIPQNMESLTKIIQALENQLTNMGDYIESFSDLSEKAESAIPIINNTLNDFTTNLKNSIDEILKEIRSNLATQQTGHKALLVSFSTLEKDTRNLCVNITSELNKLIEEFNNNSLEIIRNLSEASTSASSSSLAIIAKHDNTIDKFKVGIEKAVEEISKDIPEIVKKSTEGFLEKHRYYLENISKDQQQILEKFAIDLNTKYAEAIKKFQEIMEGSFENIDKNLKEVIKTDLQQFASRLGSISDILAKDYGPLVDNLRKFIDQLDKLKVK